MFSMAFIETEGQVEQNLLHGPHFLQILIFWIFTNGDTEAPLYAASVDNEEALHNRIVDVS
jgi:hypothetical protein